MVLVEFHVHLAKWVNIPEVVSVNFSEAPLKYEGMQPWEILISEAQERMTLAVQPEKKIDFEQLAKRDVEVSFMGKFNDSGYFTIRNKQKVIASIDMRNFCMKMVVQLWLCRLSGANQIFLKPSLPNAINYEEIVISLIGSLNICSREYKSRMYDSEVKG